MPRLRNDRHELFALALAAGQTPADAYLDAGYTTASPQATRTAAARLAIHRSIVGRLSELKGKTALQEIPPAETVEQEIGQQLDDRAFVRERLRWIIDVSMGRIKGHKIPDGQAKVALRGLDQLARASGMYQIDWDVTPPVSDPASAHAGGAGELRSVEFRERIIRLGVPADVADRLADAARRISGPGGGGSTG